MPFVNTPFSPSLSAGAGGDELYLMTAAASLAASTALTAPAATAATEVESHPTRNNGEKGPKGVRSVRQSHFRSQFNYDLLLLRGLNCPPIFTRIRDV